jgi:WD40 repeat protein
MTMNRIKLWALGLLALAVVGVGARVAVRQPVGGGDQVAAANPAKGDPPANPPGAKADLHGDPLPPGAVARLGTVRWRHASRARVLAFAAGGKEIVTAGPDGQVRVWDVATGRELRRLGKRTEPKWAELLWLRPTALSADGKRAATCDDGGVRVWDVGTGKERRRFEFENLQHLIGVALTPDGGGLLTSTMDMEPNPKVVLWDVATGEERRRFEIKVKKGDEPSPGIGGVVFSPDGKFLAAPFYEGLTTDQILRGGVRLWDVATGKEVLRVGKPLKEDEPPPNVPHPALSPDGKVIAWVAADGTIRLHGTRDGKEKRSLGAAMYGEGKRSLGAGGKDGAVSGLVFAPDGKTLASLLTDGRVRLHDAATGKELYTLGGGAPPPPAVPNSRQLMFEGPDYTPDAAPLAFSPDGKTLAAVSGEIAVRLWDTATGKLLPGPAGHCGAVADLALPADGKAVVTRGTDGMLRRWERATGKELHRLTVPEGTNPVALSPTGRLLAYADETTARVWDVAAGRDAVKIKLPQDDNDLVCLVKFSADEKVLATGGWAGPVRLWDAASGKALRTLAAAEKDGAGETLLSALEFSRDGRTLLTVRRPNDVTLVPQPNPQGPKSRLCLWDTAMGTVVRRWEVPGSVTAAALTPDGRGVVTAAADRVTLWEVATGRERFRTKGAAVVGCSPDGGVLAAAVGPAIGLLDLRTGQEFGQLTGHEAEVQVLAFTPDGEALVSGSADSTGMVWSVARPARKVEEQGGERLAELWAELADPDAGKAFRAAAELMASPKGAVALLAEHVKPVPARDAKQVRRWVAELEADSFDVRTTAARELARRGELARPALEEALQNRPSVELRRRAEELLGRLTSGEGPSAEELRHLRAVEVLEGVGTKQAREALATLAAGAPEARLTEQAKAALARWKPTR